MYLHCDRHNDTHLFTASELERVVYAMSCALAIAETENDPECRPNAGEDAFQNFPCLKEMLSAANCIEMYAEHVDGSVEARRATAPDWAQIPRTGTLDDQPLPLELNP